MNISKDNDKDFIFLDADLSFNDMTFDAGAETIFAGGSRGSGGTDDYNQLKNKPHINGKILIGNYNEIDPTVPAWAKAKDKPIYEAEEVNAIDRDNIITESEIDLLFLRIFGD